MSSNLTALADLIATEIAPEIASNAYGESRYLSLADRVTGLSNKKFVTFGRPTAGLVSIRGGNKPTSEIETDTLELIPAEFAVIVAFHKDLLNLPIEDAAVVVARDAQDAIARSVDFTIENGEDELGVSAPSGFGTLEGIASEPVTDTASFYAAMKATIADGRSADAAVVTKGLWLDLLSARTALGAPEFSIAGDMNGGTINGIDVRIVEGSDSKGILGAFKSGTKGGIANDLEVKVLEEATIPWKGGMLNLPVTNHVALRLSGNFFYGYFNEDNFVQIGSAAS